MTILSIGKFRNTCCLYKILEHFHFLTPFWSFQNTFWPLLVKLFEDINSLWELICINFLFLFTITLLCFLFTFWCFHNNGLIVCFPEGINLFFYVFFELPKHRWDNIFPKPFVGLFYNGNSLIFDSNIFFIVKKFNDFRDVWFKIFHFVNSINSKKLHNHCKIVSNVFSNLTFHA